MPAPQELLRIDGCDVLLVGTIPGFVPDADRVQTAARDHRPDAIALGVPAADLSSLEALVADPTLADGLEPDALDLHFLEQIANWGATQLIPSPDLHAAHATGLPLHGIDMDDEAHTQLFTDTVKVRHLVQRSSIRKRLGKTTADDAPDAYGLAILWDDALCEIKPLAAIEQARLDHMAAEVRRLAADVERLLVVVHAAKYAGLFTRLSDGS